MGTPARPAQTRGRGPHRPLTARAARPAARRIPGLSRAVAVGESIFLRRPAAPDKAEYTALRRASRGFLERWEPRPPAGQSVFGPAAFDRYFKSSRAAGSDRLLICRVEDGSILGQIGIGGILRGAFRSCFMGYWIGEPFARQGYATEAVRLMLGRIFGDLGLHRVEANIQPNNAASIALIKRCGFRLEGYSPRYLQIAGRWRDHERWAMTIEDWKRTGRRRLRPGRTPARSPAST